MSLVFWVLWGEIKVDFDDLKHIVHLIRRFDELSGIIVVIALQLLQLTSLLEQCLRGSTALILQNLLLLEVGTLCALDELVTVILVPHLQVVQSIAKSLNLFFTFTQLLIQFVTVSLELFLLLSSLDDEVSLTVLAAIFARALLVSLG